MTAVTSFENTISDTGLLRENDHEGGWEGGGLENIFEVNVKRDVAVWC